MGYGSPRTRCRQCSRPDEWSCALLGRGASGAPHRQLPTLSIRGNVVPSHQTPPDDQRRLQVCLCAGPLPVRRRDAAQVSAHGWSGFVPGRSGGLDRQERTRLGMGRPQAPVVEAEPPPVHGQCTRFDPFPDPGIAAQVVDGVQYRAALDHGGAGVQRIGRQVRPPVASSARDWAGTVLAMASQEPKNPDSGAVPQAASIMALTPPQRACPNTTICDTPSVLTPYSSTARTLSPRPPPASQGGARLATLRTVKTSPGPVERQALPSRGYRQDRAGGLVTGNLPFGSADHLPHVGKPAAYRGGSPQVLDAAVGANTPYVGILLWGSM